MSKTFQTADVCELAHELTVRECARLNIKVDEDEETYTNEAQDIFNRFSEWVEHIWETEGKVNERDLDDDGSEVENKSIRIPVSTNDAEELRDGGSFEWTFPVEDSKTGEWIDVELYHSDDEMEESE